MYAFKQWRATLGQRSHATQTNACKSVEHGHARARPRKCYTLSELEQLAEYNAVYMYTVDVQYMYVHVLVRCALYIMCMYMYSTYSTLYVYMSCT